jgi:hypothetical protein
LASQAAEVHTADYAFSLAAQVYEVAALHSTGADQVDLMVRHADALRFCGRWREARIVLQQAARLARQLAIHGREAIALVHMERLTWTYGLDEQELTQQFREVMTPGRTGRTAMRLVIWSPVPRESAALLLI